MKRRKRNIILVLVLLFLMLLAGVAYYIWELKITDITVIGNNIYTDEEIISYVFPSEIDYHTLYELWRGRTEEQEKIPFVKSYEVNITGVDSAEIVVYEKGIIGALKYMGTYLYFDSDGYIVDTSTHALDGVVAIDGITFEYFALNDKLPVEDDDIFGSILVLSKSVTAEQLEIDRIYLDQNMEITLYMGELLVVLGDGSNLENKVHALSDILPTIKEKNLKGTLYLNTSSTVLDTKEYFFKEDTSDKETTEAETTTDVNAPETEPGPEETETTERPTEGIPVLEIDEKTGEVIIRWTTAESTTEEIATESETVTSEYVPVQTEPVPGTEDTVEAVTETPSEVIPSEVIPSDVPSEVIPSDVPSEVIPSDVPSEVIPSDVPSEVIPSEVPPEMIPTEAPAEVIPSDIPAEVIPSEQPSEVLPV